ncbi:uncharacterized protein PAC_15902 [Phialocephala subalpina]|uniref:Cell division cycle protein 123 n=1 Tax=Phialocephala subalpina TaxID=576137 RepID=A0A1L7XLT6_9HELO|nr:uncharacterized protein PAC_15902 [Phialocephala subalpina]
MRKIESQPNLPSKMPGEKLKLVKIDSALVAANEENYNSNFHTEAEAPGEFIPTEVPQSFERWLPLIVRSQNIPLERVQTITLTNAQAQLIIDASRSSLHTRELSRIYAEELEELASLFQSLLFPAQGLFLRLDACSPKDGVRGVSPLKTTKDIVLRLTTSHRATNSILRCMERGEEVYLFFLPFDEHMRTEKEYRVFCAPPDGRVTCISQYRWHKPNLFAAHSEDDIAAIMEDIKKAALAYHNEILVGLNIGRDGEMDRLLLEQGFTFDIMFDEGSGECKLIELNSFGARSGCGSCLFHWLADWDVLYGKTKAEGAEANEIELRITT